MAAVVKDGQLVWSGAVGIADLEHDIDLAVDHRLRIGSVSKPLTAVLTLRLAQADIISLDTEISHYIPELPSEIGSVTARQLGSHISGIRHFNFANFAEANNMMYRHRLVEGINFFADDPLLFAPGEEFEYSSFGYNLLGAVLEHAGDGEFGKLFDAHVTKTFGLDQTRIDHPFDIIEGRVGFYTVTAENPFFTWMKNGEVINTIFRDSSDYYPSGGMLSSASDLARFTAQIFESDILTEEMRALISTPAKLNSGAAAGFNENVLYSFGWEIHLNEAGEIRSYGHNGETNGAYAMIRYFPKTGLAVAGIANYNIVGNEPVFFGAIGDALPALFTD